MPRSAAASRFACFYLNPTTSRSQTATGNTSLAVTSIDTYIATEEGAPFSQVCDMGEYNLVLGSLLNDVAGQEAAWESRH